MYALRKEHKLNVGDGGRGIVSPFKGSASPNTARASKNLLPKKRTIDRLRLRALSTPK